MTLIVEDGTGLPDSEAYCDTTFADKYFSDRGFFDWATTTPSEKERGLRLATDYIEFRFASSFRGCRANKTQALSFPREGVTVDTVCYDNIVPLMLKKACAEYAYRALKNPLAPDIQTDPTGLRIKATQERAGPIDERVEYEPGMRDLFKPYPAADNLLKSLLRPAGLIR